MAGQPFALWLATNGCTALIPTSYDDRVVRVDGNTVHVFVPELPNLCGVPPPGEYHTLLNMPALPAGEYTLHVTYYATTPDIEPWLDAPLQFVVAPGVLAPAPTLTATQQRYHPPASATIPATGGAPPPPDVLETTPVVKSNSAVG